MTMQLTRNQLIGGVPAIKVRRLLQLCRGGFQIDWLTDRGYSEAQARELVQGLLQGGYMELNPDKGKEVPWYRTTELGKSLIRASAAKRITRKTADKALTDFMERVHEVNSNPRFLIRIVNLVLYGSYVRGATDLGDLDIAYDWEPKIDDREEYEQAALAHFEATGRPDDSFGFASHGWPEKEVKLFLKNRQRTFSLQDLSSFFRMPKTEGFSYRVLLGDPKHIADQLKKAAYRNGVCADETTSVRSHLK